MGDGGVCDGLGGAEGSPADGDPDGDDVMLGAGLSVTVALGAGPSVGVTLGAGLSVGDAVGPVAEGEAEGVGADPDDEGDRVGVAESVGAEPVGPVAEGEGVIVSVGVDPDGDGDIEGAAGTGSEGLISGRAVAGWLDESERLAVGCDARPLGPDPGAAFAPTAPPAADSTAAAVGWVAPVVGWAARSERRSTVDRERGEGCAAGARVLATETAPGRVWVGDGVVGSATPADDSCPSVGADGAAARVGMGSSCTSGSVRIRSMSAAESTRTGESATTSRTAETAARPTAAAPAATATHAVIGSQCTRIPLVCPYPEPIPTQGARVLPTSCRTCGPARFTVEACHDYWWWRTTRASVPR